MASNRLLYTILTTDKSPNEIRQAVKKAFRLIGGQIIDTPDSIIIDGGTLGLNCSFAVDLSARINLWELEENTYRLECSLLWKLNALSWICLVAGWFFLWPLWFVPMCASFFKPEPVYYQALNTVEDYL